MGRTLRAPAENFFSCSLICFVYQRDTSVDQEIEQHDVQILNVSFMYFHVQMYSQYLCIVYWLFYVELVIEKVVKLLFNL